MDDGPAADLTHVCGAAQGHFVAPPPPLSSCEVSAGEHTKELTGVPTNVKRRL